MPKIQGANGSLYTVDGIISETDTEALVKLNGKTFKLRKAYVLEKSSPKQRLTMTEAATMLKDTRIRKAAQNQLQRDDGEETTPAPRTAAEASYQDQLEKEDASEPLMSTVIARAAAEAGATYAVEVAQGEGKRSHLFAADVKANREQKLQEAEAAERARVQAQLEARLAVTKAADDSDDEMLAAIRAAAPFKAGS